MNNATPSPPKWIDRLLGWLMEDKLHEAVMGDLEEKYKKRIDRESPVWIANLLYALEGLGFIRMSRKRKFNNPTDMYRNYLLTALRNISKDRLYLVLNISGLAIGIACVLTIFTYVKFELSYDHFHANAERIYRIPEEYVDNGQLISSAMNHSPMAPILSEHLAGVKNVIRVFPYAAFFNAFVSSTPERTFKENNFCFGDSLFFDTFTFNSIGGPLNHALDAPFSVVITRDMAEKYFSTTQDVIGKPLTFQNDVRSFTFYVTGVIENIPQTSHFSFDFMASISTLEQFMPWFDNWHHPAMYIYVEMSNKVDPQALSESIQKIASQHQPQYVLEEKRKYNAQALTDIHLHSHLENEWEPNSHYSYIQVYIVTGIFILIIACINFMNLATARSSGRAREVGMRKVLGGRRGQLVAQFLCESFVYCVISFVVAIGIAELSFRHFFNDVIGKQLSLLGITNWQALAMAVSFIVVLSILSGLYPAFFLSSFRPVRVLKGSVITGAGSSGLRKGLVTFQFFISCLLISTTIIIIRQVDFMRNKELGFDQEHIISIKLSDRYAQQNYQQLKDELLSETTVENVAMSSVLPGGSDFYAFDIVPEGSDGKAMSLKTLGVDEDFISTYNLDLLNGRDFSKDIVTDQVSAFVLNESAGKRLGWTDPVGKELELTVYINGAVQRKGKVIGVVSDFHFQSLHSSIEPLVLYINKHPYYSDYLSVKFKGGNVSESIQTLTKAWKDFHPEKPIEYHFLDDELENLYASEIKISRIFNVLAGISIFISCLGLFGLSAFIAEKRTKEVGIRKVMGASILQIIQLQTREFMLLIIIANVLVWPLAWWWANDWISGFAYHININPLIFAVTLFLALLLVLLTLSYHSVKVARMNPVNTLRYE